MIEGNERLIIILGMAHSGTTILAKLLSQHPNIYLEINGEESYLLENDWIPQENKEAIELCLQEHLDQRVLLKRPWSIIRNEEFLLRECPQARYLYCYRKFIEIIKSWSRSVMIDINLKNGTEEFQRSVYRGCWKAALQFKSQVSFFREVGNHSLRRYPEVTMKSLETWLELDPFVWDIGEVR